MGNGSVGIHFFTLVGVCFEHWGIFLVDSLLMPWVDVSYVGSKTTRVTFSKVYINEKITLYW